jgi:hypothetical protein
LYRFSPDVSAFPPATLFSCVNTFVSDDVPGTDTFSSGKYQKTDFGRALFSCAAEGIFPPGSTAAQNVLAEFKRDGIAPWEARM